MKTLDELITEFQQAREVTQQAFQTFMKSRTVENKDAYINARQAQQVVYNLVQNYK